MLLQGSILGLSGAVLSFGASRALGQGSLFPRLAIPVVLGISLFYTESIEVRRWLASVPQLAKTLSFIPEFKRLEILSPLLGLLQITSTRTSAMAKLFPGAPGWYGWIGVSLAAGCAMWLAAHLLDRRRTRTQQEVVTLVFNPTILGREAFSDPVQLKRTGYGKTDTPVVLALIARVQQIWDNAVVTRELRSRLRGQWDRPVIWTSLGFALLFSIIFFHPALALYPTIFGGWLSFLLMGSMRNPLAVTAAGILGCWYLGLFIAAVSNAFVTTGAFFAETQKSTLGFLLSTPMTTRSIVLGKAAGILGPSMAILASMAAWTLALTVLFLPMVGPLALLGWLYAVLTALTFYLMVNAITFAISAMFPKLSMSGSAWVWVLIFWFGSGPLAWMWGLMSLALVAMGLQASSIWFAFITIGWLLIFVAYAMSISSIQSLRRRDLGFATSKRNN